MDTTLSTVYMLWMILSYIYFKSIQYIQNLNYGHFALFKSQLGEAAILKWVDLKS